MQKKILLASLCVALLALLSGMAAADTVTYNGATFGLFLIGQSGNTYTIQYTANFSGWNAAAQPNQDFLAAVNFQLGGQTPTSSVLTSTDAPGTWTVVNANVTNNGCTGGSTSFTCAQVSPLTSVPTTTSASFFWDFDVTYASALTASDFLGAPIRAWFVDANGGGAGLMSLRTNVTTPPPPSVPEPASLALLGIGLVGAARIAKRRLTQ